MDSHQCKVMQVSHSGYYDYLKRAPSKKELLDVKLIVEIKVVAKESRNSYGKRRIAKYLQMQGHKIGVFAVINLMRKTGVAQHVTGHNP